MGAGVLLVIGFNGARGECTEKRNHKWIGANRSRARLGGIQESRGAFGWLVVGSSRFHKRVFW